MLPVDRFFFQFFPIPGKYGPIENPRPSRTKSRKFRGPQEVLIFYRTEVCQTLVYHPPFSTSTIQHPHHSAHPPFSTPTIQHTHHSAPTIQNTLTIQHPHHSAHPPFNIPFSNLIHPQASSSAHPPPFASCKKTRPQPSGHSLMICNNSFNPQHRGFRFQVW